LKGTVRVGAVDMTENESVGAPYDVKGFPTLKWFGFDKKKPEAYEGQREAGAIVEYSLNKLVKEVKGRGKGGSKSSSGSGEQKQKKAATDKDVVVLTDANFDA